MNNDALREKHDQLLTKLYNEETLLEEMLSKKTYQNEEEVAATVKKIKALEEELNKARIEMYYL